ncbi:peptidoglycan recognition family protein [Paenibacillus sp. 1781tsa1]|uniref:peptidoglycan recognition protein family protein n=1 Tax=Paenibacillus sp. 1781tsa1 TaxID=2953810 RepID=UPI00209E746C|nr:peptidoglycan recognition family protein [Paenibacillus sp. 1781tsa1]MCP1185123.1 peptidoglycan recognition protein family protein [Paenibacillus sp. 1781tsa1]
MIQKGNFLLLDISEFRSWLQKQKVTRRIKGLQVHHTGSPNYTTRKMVNGIAQQDHFKCLEGMRDFHINTNKWKATGQHLTLFEDGKVGVSLDRDLNMTPACIYNNNAGYVGIEIVGCFDKGVDIMTPVQKQAAIHLYATLCEKFYVPVNTDKIVYHAWFTASGTRLSDYTPGKSSKSCPGTAYWGDGNTIASANKNFLPQVKVELDRLRNNITSATPIPNTKPKDDEEMTEAEKQQVASLEKTIQQQSEWIQAEKLKANMECPTWAQEAYKYYKDHISDNKGSYDFWRILVTQYRKDNNIKVSK